MLAAATAAQVKMAATGTYPRDLEALVPLTAPGMNHIPRGSIYI
jgi:hypothetical protein